LTTRWFLTWALVAAVSVGCAPSLTDVKPALAASDSGTVWFATAGTLVPSPDGSRYEPGEPVVLSGILEFPRGAGPVPAVILAHGCSGIGQHVAGWASLLRDWGYATFALDSFHGRGLREVCSSALTLIGTQRIPDAYGALRLLSTHPRIDASRVALMGFSHGGILTLGASTQWAKDTYASAGRPAFRAFLPFYPYCNTIYPGRERIAAPLRIHTGELDDWTPSAPCAQLVDAMRAAGHDATIDIYPRAHHAFDNSRLGLLHLPNADNAGHCVFHAGSIVGPFPPRADVAGCLRKGATIGGNAEAAAMARRNVRTQLAALLS
jgi:dienelactone hydrolase